MKPFIYLVYLITGILLPMIANGADVAATKPESKKIAKPVARLHGGEKPLNSLKGSSGMSVSVPSNNGQNGSNNVIADTTSSSTILKFNPRHDTKPDQKTLFSE